MPKELADQYNNWVGGVVTSAAADSLPPNSIPRGRNTTLVKIGQGSALVGCRRGMSVGNQTPITSSPTILGQYQLKRADGSKIHLLVSSGGRLDKLNGDATTSAIGASAFTSGVHWPNFATISNNALISNGVDLKKTDGTSVWGVGITRPAAPTAGAGAGGSMSAGAWDVGLTYLNSSTGEESSLSDFTTATLSGGNLKISISWSAPADTQVDYVRVYLRKQTLGPNVYLMATGSIPAVNATWLGFAVATTSTSVDLSDVLFQALTVLAPSTTSNNPPTVTWQYPVWHNSRLFLFDGGNAYYSNIKGTTPHPESFDPLNIQPLGANDGDIITGAVSVPTGGDSPNFLLIFKRNAMWVIDGVDPNSWTVTRIDDRHGCGSHRTIKIAGDVVCWWANTSMGMLAMPVGSRQPLEIGKELLSASFADDQLNNAMLSLACAEVDEANDLILFAVPTVGITDRNTLMFPYNYRIKRFVSDGWNPIDVASMAIIEDSLGARNIYIGGFAGQIFLWDTGTNDGVPTSTTKAGTITASTSSTITDSTAAFSSTGGKLVERYVYHIPSMGSVQRRRITGNTATQLTVSPNWSQTPVPGETYIVGGIDWQLDLPLQDSGAEFVKKNFSFIYCDLQTSQSGVVVYVDVFTNISAADALVTPRRTVTLSTSATGAVWDSSVWDEDSWDGSGSITQKRKIGLTGKNYRLRIRQLQSDKQISVFASCLVQGWLLSNKT